MEWLKIIGAALVALGVPSAVFALLLRRLERKLDQTEQHQAQLRQSKQELEQFQIHTLWAVAALCEATALAQQRGHCNGETKAALEHMREVKHEMRDFLMRQGVDHLQ